MCKIHYIILFVRTRTCARKEPEKFYKKQGKTAAKPEAANEIRKKERNFYTDKEELFTFPLRETYGSATQNIRFTRRKHMVQRKELYKTTSYLIKNSLTLLQGQRVFYLKILSS